MAVEKARLAPQTMKYLCEEYLKNNYIDPETSERLGVKRGLRNPDGTGVLAGLTNVCDVVGYDKTPDGKVAPIPGKLIYRGINVEKIVEEAYQKDRFMFEEVIWLLLFGTLPTAGELAQFCEILESHRALPDGFAEDMIMKAPSPNIMNKMARSVLALYSYDDNPDDPSLENNMRQAIQLIARLPTIMTYAYQVKRRHFDRQSMFFHPLDPNHSTAEAILNAIRPDRVFTDEEAKLLDLCMILHAEHGGGNNSTFTTRVLSSTGTDIYSAISAAIGSLKGPRHGGANHRVMMMMDDLMGHVKNWESDDEVGSYLEKIVRKEAGDRSGLIYGMGHAVYTLSDPRAVILKENARKMAEEHGMLRKFELFERVEKLSPDVFAKVKNDRKVISANVDFYSGLVYEMLGIPSDLYTPMFAVSRIAGWCAHRIEEVMTPGDRLITTHSTELSHASEVLLNSKIEKLPVVDDAGRLVGLITYKDITKVQDHPNACKDAKGRLRVAAGVGVTPDAMDRVKALVAEDVDAVVLDSAHGHSANIVSMLKRIKEVYPSLDVVVGNIATGGAARYLIENGADGVKVGIGPGSICTTRIIAGVGVPQLTAIYDVACVARESGVPVIADGGLRYSGDLVKALAAGGDCVMIGSMFAGTEEAPGETIIFNGRKFKSYRGMGSIDAMKAGSADRYFQKGCEGNISKLVPEGIAARVPFKGSLSETVYQLIGGVRSGMGYCGAKDIETLKQARFIRITASGMQESHPHDVAITSEAPNYSSER